MAKSSQPVRTGKTAPTHADINRYAHDLWIRDGRPEGRALEHWLAAERALTFPNPEEREKADVPSPRDLPPPMGAIQS